MKRSSSKVGFYLAQGQDRELPKQRQAQGQDRTPPKQRQTQGQDRAVPKQRQAQGQDKALSKDRSIFTWYFRNTDIIFISSHNFPKN
jgi:hypothetical protein